MQQLRVGQFIVFHIVNMKEIGIIVAPIIWNAVMAAGVHFSQTDIIFEIGCHTFQLQQAKYANHEMIKPMTHFPMIFF